jgi:type IV secretory pathway VirB4 component
MSLFLKSNKKASSRQQIAIKGVRDGVLMLPNNKYRMVLKASSINFELKSEDEQDALIETYQNFLNSLASPLQIVIRVREMDMDKYLEEFRAQIQNESEAIYREQMQNYTDFVGSLITKNKILSRQFYIVIPHDSKDTKEFDLIYEQLSLSADIVTKGLARLGIRTQQLSSLEILDLFYSFYNPGQAKRQPITDHTMQLLKEVFV